MRSLFIFRLAILCLGLATTISTAQAETQESSPELIVCSQNLNRFMENAQGTPSARDGQILKAFLRRVKAARCELIGLQEVFGQDQRQAQATLKTLREYLQKETGEEFDQFIGASNDHYIRNAYLLKQGVAEVIALKSYADYRLPRLYKNSSTHKFSRGPLLLHLRLRKKEASKERARSAQARELLVYNLHFKSKYNSWKDPLRLQYEDLRMEMAEALREIVFADLQRVKANSIALVVGDRNSDRESASAKIAYGAYHLNDFSSQGSCEVDRDLEANCLGAFRERKKVLDSLFERKMSEASSYRYQNKDYLYDDFLLRPKDRRLFLDKQSKTLRAGFAGTFERSEVLDHLMPWAALDF